MNKKKVLALTLAAAMTIGVTACGSKSGNDSSGTEITQSSTRSADSSSQQAVSGSSENTAEQDASQAAAQGPDFSTGTPWINSSVTGTLLSEDQQNKKDDYYQAENYSFLSQNQETSSITTAMENSKNSLAERFLTYLSQNMDSTELNKNIALMYNQASDGDTLTKQDLTSVQKYLDMIDGASNIEELNKVFTSEDYPFDAFISSCISAHYMDGKNIVTILPHFFAVDDLDGAQSYRNYPIDFSSQEGLSILSSSAGSIAAFLKMGYSAEELGSLYASAIQLESVYGKDAPYNSESALTDYGKVSDLYNYVTLDELQSHAGNFPIREILAKEGRDTSETYQAGDIQWLDSLASVYTDKNIDLIKLIAKLQLLKETKPYTCLAYADLETTANSGVYSERTLTDDVKVSAGYEAISESKTFAQAIASIDKNEIMKQEDADRLTGLTKDLINQYRQTVSENKWLDDDSKNAIYQKLDAMTLNILEPDCGYIDYSGVQLKTAEEGGTLVDDYITLKKHFTGEMNKLIGTPSKSELAWQEVAPTAANAFYDPDTNSINIYPGVISDASYRSDMTDEELYGGIGSILSHEISHAFDYAGTQFDYLGKTKSIVSEADLDEFLAVQQKVIDRYSTFTEAENLPVDGRKVVVEGVADLSGLEMLHKLAAAKEGFDYDSFYKTYANLYAAAQTPYITSLMYSIDTHPANYLRVNANLQMFDEFYKTYGIAEEDGMYLDPASRITIW